MATEALADTRVVVVNGARQVGKSTLAELIVARSAGARELYLDDQAVRGAAEADPRSLLNWAASGGRDGGSWSRLWSRRRAVG